MATRKTRTTRNNIHDFVLSTSEDGNTKNVVRVEVGYNEGGMNYFNYKEEKRGLYLSVSPLEIEKSGGCICTKYTGFSGVKVLIKEMKRFSQKQLNECMPEQEIVQRLLDSVCTQQGITTLDASVIYQPEAQAA